MLRIRRAVGISLGDVAYDMNVKWFAAFCYYHIAMYPRRMRVD